MEQAIEITREAFIAHINDVCRRQVVDVRYELDADGKRRVFLVYSDGTEVLFRGLSNVA